MKKTATVFSLLCAALLLCATPVFAAFEASGNGITGADWLNSTQEAKLNFLLGVETTLAMEHALEMEKANSQKEEPELSPFMSGWVTVFGNTPRQQIMEKIDAFLVSNPQSKDRHIFDIIWLDFMVPAKAAK